MKLTVICSTAAFFPTHPTVEGGPSTPVRPFDYQYFAIDYTLYNNILLVNNAPIELRSSIASLVSHETRAAINARVVTPHGITPSFWPFGDSAELHWQGEQAYAGLPIIVRRQFDDLTHLFELLPDLSNLPSNMSDIKPPSVNALIRLRWDENRMSEEFNTIDCVVSDTPYSQSPSHTYYIRYYMLSLIGGPLKWMVEVLGATVEAIFRILGQIAGTIVLYICFAAVGSSWGWFSYGRPSAEAILRSANRRTRVARVENVCRRLDDLRAHEARKDGSLPIALIFSAFTGRSHRYASEARRKRLAEKVDLEKGASLD